MKKSIHFIPLIILLALFAGSCKTSLMKRHYRNGYFVEHKHKNNPASENDKQSVASTKKRSVASKTETAFAQTTTASPKKEAAISSEETVVQKKTINSTQEKAMKLAKKANDLGPVKLDENKLRAVAAKQNADMDGSTADDALSLFWIVLLVILILYLLGFVFDGYGLGILVHLLLLIFLILLILWLLRIV